MLTMFCIYVVLCPSHPAVCFHNGSARPLPHKRALWRRCTYSKAAMPGVKGQGGIKFILHMTHTYVHSHNNTVAKPSLPLHHLSRRCTTQHCTMAHPLAPPSHNTLLLPPPTCSGGDPAPPCLPGPASSCSLRYPSRSTREADAARMPRGRGREEVVWRLARHALRVEEEAWLREEQTRILLQHISRACVRPHRHHSPLHFDRLRHHPYVSRRRRSKYVNTPKGNAEATRTQTDCHPMVRAV